MSRPFCLGLTGSIGMGKSTTAGLFAEAGCAVWDADAAVRRLYGPGGAAVAPVTALCPESVTGDAAGDEVDRTALKAWLARDPAHWGRLESVVHPLVAKDRAAFLRGTAADVVVLDIPLLFETGGGAGMDATAVVSAPEALQRARVLARPGMTEAQLDAILARQMPDAEKRALADYVIPTETLDAARAAVHDVLRDIGGRHA